MAVTPDPHELTWGVGAVAERLGVAAATLRTWERRYAIGPSFRTDGGHRRYTAGDIERVEHMRRLLARGVRPRDAAREARDLDDETVAAAVAGELPGDGHLSPDELVVTIVEAASELDPVRLSSLYAGALRRLGVARAWHSVMAPALIAIGEAWAEGRVEITVEHLASERLLAELRLMSRTHAAPPMQGGVVLTSAEDDQHSLPLFALEAALAEQGCGSFVAGARMPWSSLVTLSQRLRPDAVFVWATLDRGRDEAFAAATAELPTSTRLVIGGPGWGAFELPRAERAHNLDQALTLIGPRTA